MKGGSIGMARNKIDCKDPEAQIDGHGGLQCKWCGRPVQYNSTRGKYLHKHNWKRQWPDPRTGDVAPSKGK
jgi:hypothetical protein